jgi:hypothetical protein
MIVPRRGCNVSMMDLAVLWEQVAGSGYSIPSGFGDVIVVAVVVVL